MTSAYLFAFHGNTATLKLWGLLSSSRAFCGLEEAHLNVTFSWMLLSLIGIWKLCALSLGREEMQFELLPMNLLTFFFFFVFSLPESNIVRDYLEN